MPIYKKLSLLLIAIITMLIAAVYLLGLWGAHQYQQELTQRLHSDTASYINSHLNSSLIDQEGNANLPLLKQVALHAMMINPLVEVYLLDKNGVILGHALHTEDIILKKINVEPIKKYLNNNHKNSLIYGENPRKINKKEVFSVTEIKTNNNTQGFLYVILASKKLDILATKISSSHVLRLLFFYFLITSSIVSVFGLYGFYKITSPLKKLKNIIEKFKIEESMKDLSNNVNIDKKETTNEIENLKSTFYLMQQRIDNQFNDLNKKENLRKELFSNISHDLRTPITSIQGYIEILLIKNNNLNNEEKIKYLTIAHKNCQRTATLINTLFELSKLESIDDKIKLEKFCLSDLINDIIHQYGIATNKKISINFSSTSKNIFVEANLQLIERVFQNLIDNAIKFSNEYGEIKIILTKKNKTVDVSIIDNGLGIESHELPYVFDRYYQSNNHNDNSGSGLGLAITKRILEMHNTNIEVASKLSRGTKFSFNLPLSE